MAKWLAGVVTCGVFSVSCAETMSTVVSMDHVQATSPENALVSLTTAQILEINVTRRNRGAAINRVALDCEVAGIHFQHDEVVIPGNWSYRFYPKIAASEARQIPTGEHDLSCTISLDGIEHRTRTTVYLRGAPIFPKLETAKEALTAYSCDSGARPREGKRVCVFMFAINRAHTHGLSNHKLTMTCEMGGKHAEAELPIGESSVPPTIEFVGLSAGTHQARCEVEGTSLRAETEVVVLPADAPRQQDLRLDGVSSLKYNEARFSGEMGPSPASVDMVATVTNRGTDPVQAFAVRCELSNGAVAQGRYNGRSQLPPGRFKPGMSQDVRLYVPAGKHGWDAAMTGRCEVTALDAEHAPTADDAPADNRRDVKFKPIAR